MAVNFLFLFRQLRRQVVVVGSGNPELAGGRIRQNKGPVGSGTRLAAKIRLLVSNRFPRETAHTSEMEQCLSRPGKEMANWPLGRWRAGRGMRGECGASKKTTPPESPGAPGSDGELQQTDSQLRPTRDSSSHEV